MPRLAKTEEQRQRNREYQRKWFAANKEKQRKRVAANSKRYKEAAFGLCRQYKEKGCARCPETDIACLDFHHLDQSVKEIGIAQAVQRGWSLTKIENEILKCEVLCSNCHRKEHRNERV